MSQLLGFGLRSLQFFNHFLRIDGLHFPESERSGVLDVHTFDEDFPAFELLEVAHADAFLEEHLGKISPLADGVQTTQVGLMSQHPTGKSRPSATDLQMSQFDAFPASRFHSVN